ncbi:MAG: hypothetical protein JW913_16120 [Chitinispirillaceae bacterium]|nr:hypothetical protein [Chitinispirillaceae bacterium]
MKNSMLSFSIALTGALLFARAADVADERNIVVSPKGYGAVEIGQIGHGHYKQGDAIYNQSISHIWQQRALANIGFDVKYREILTIEIIGEGMMAFSTPQLGLEPTTLQPRHFFYIKSSNAKISLGKPSFLSGEIQVGYFPYKYNSDVRNLGEYLFRSNPYPLVVYADFDYPQANLLGLRLNFQGFDKLFSDDLLLHSELITLPSQNWSISDIAEVNLFKVGTIGLGASLHHFLNVYQGKYMPTTFEEYYYPENLSEDEQKAYSDTVLNNHKAIKLMGRASLDLKQLISVVFMGGNPLPLFNRNDLRIYGEIDMLGLDTFPVYYTDRANQMIYSFGVNLPGLFVLDFLNVEFEYCKNRTEFSDERFFGDQRPMWEPPRKFIDEQGDTVSRAPWRWSVYCKKSFFKDHLSLVAQFARDHKKINFYYFQRKWMSFRETLPTKEDWWWTFKTEFKF